MNFNTVYNRSVQKLAGRYNTQSASEASMNKSAMEKKANVLLGVLALALGAGINAGIGAGIGAGINKLRDKDVRSGAIRGAGIGGGLTIGGALGGELGQALTGTLEGGAFGNLVGLPIGGYLGNRAATDYMKRNSGNTKKASYNQYKKVAATQAAFAPIKGLPDALKPVPTPMKIDNPQQAVGNAQMDQAAAAEGVGADTPQQPISDKDIAAKAIETVDKGNQALLKYLTQSKKNDQAVQQTYQQPANPGV